MRVRVLYYNLLQVRIWFAVRELRPFSVKQDVSSDHLKSIIKHTHSEGLGSAVWLTLIKYNFSFAILLDTMAVVKTSHYIHCHWY